MTRRMPTPPPQAADPAEQLKLAVLHQSGSLTDEEFVQQPLMAGRLVREES
jgi:hypothetical protein